MIETIILSCHICNIVDLAEILPLFWCRSAVKNVSYYLFYYNIVEAIAMLSRSNFYLTFFLWCFCTNTNATTHHTVVVYAAHKGHTVHHKHQVDEHFHYYYYLCYCNFILCHPSRNRNIIFSLC